jgi:hypothetical protein
MFEPKHAPAFGTGSCAMFRGLVLSQPRSRVVRSRQGSKPEGGNARAISFEKGMRIRHRHFAS